LVLFYKIIKLTIAIITTTNAIALKPAPPIHTTKGQCGNNTTAHKQLKINCHPIWKTTQKENAKNRTIKRHVELFTSNTKLKHPMTKQSTKTAITEIKHNNPIKEQHKKKKGKQQKRSTSQPHFAASKQKTLSNGTTYSSKHPSQTK
jgi:hypothetical protein